MDPDTHLLGVQICYCKLFSHQVALHSHKHGTFSLYLVKYTSGKKKKKVSHKSCRSYRDLCSELCSNFLYDVIFLEIKSYVSVYLICIK
jgi:hypothetical protein